MTTALEASFVVLWALVLVLAIAALTRHKPPSAFASGIFSVMVVLQYYYIYQAARRELAKKIEAI
jgi:hypothetical protein